MPTKPKKEIGSLPEQQLPIMIVKMIPNFENKMEFQINTLEMKIQKLQEIFDKDLEEIKKSQPIMKNAIRSVQSLSVSCSLRPHDCSTPSLPVHHQLPSLLKLMFIESVMPSKCLILCRPLFPPSIFPSIRVFSSASVLSIMWPSIGVSASASVLPMSIQD